MDGYFELIKDEETGQGMVEYSLILVLIVVVCIAAATILGEGVLVLYNNTVNNIPG
jgi:pilus assembly protein Flp/PilA